MADTSIASNIAVLKSRARQMRYIPARAMANTLTDPAKLLLVIPNGQTLTSGAKLTVVSFGAIAAPALVEIPPAQAPKGLLVAANNGSADAIPSWTDGFAVVPVPPVTANAAISSAIQQAFNNLFTFGRIVWKGDEEIKRTVYLGDCQRKENAWFAQSSIAADLGGSASMQAACGAPGAPVYQTPGFCYTGRASAEFYIEYLGANIANASGFDIVLAVYVYGQYVLNIDPLQSGTADAIRGGTYGAATGSCQANAVNALQGSVDRMPPPAAQAVRRTSIRCG